LGAVKRKVSGTDLSKTISDSIYNVYEKQLVKLIMEGPLPEHVAIIMDGNRRFAEDLGMEPFEGHQFGRDKLEEVLDWCLELNIRILTVYAFSSENVERSEEEVRTLMELFVRNFKQLATDERVHRHRIRVRVLGQKDKLPEELQAVIDEAESNTEDYDSYYFNLAIAYGGRQEIIQAIRTVAQECVDGKVKPENIDEKLFTNYLYTSDIPDPDLVLRTSGEERISNFLLWQLAYSELYFTDVFWPGFRKTDFLRAIRSYQMRRRRYGK